MSPSAPAPAPAAGSSRKPITADDIGPMVFIALILLGVLAATYALTIGA